MSDGLKQTTLTEPVHVVAENVVDLGDYIHEGCQQVGLGVTNRDALSAASIVVGDQPVAVPATGARPG